MLAPNNRKTFWLAAALRYSPLYNSVRVEQRSHRQGIEIKIARRDDACASQRQ